jgi:modulator of FtsH protease
VTFGAALDLYEADSWHDFFVATAGAGAALTGLLFVAISLHIRYVATDPKYRGMARGSLAGLVMVVVLSLIVLIHQPSTWLGLELAAAGVLYVPIGAGMQAASTRSARGTSPRSTLVRSAVGYLIAVVGVLGGLSVALQVGPGLFVVALIVIGILLWNLWVAWGLLMGVADEEIAKT